MAPALSRRTCELRGRPALACRSRRVGARRSAPSTVSDGLEGSGVGKTDRGGARLRIQPCGFFRLDGLGAGKAHGRKPRTDSHYRAPSAAKRRQSSFCCLSPLPEATACPVRLEGEPNTDQLCVPGLVGVSGG